MNEGIRQRFPKFAESLDRGLGEPIENVLDPASTKDIAKLERKLGIPLPVSYKAFLECTRGFWAMGGVVQLSAHHPFFHDFPPLKKLTKVQKNVVMQRGGHWPPPSQGMLCFAEFFMKADGDQVLFDISKGLVNGEYPVFYYAHEDTPPSVRKIADSFEQWLTEFLEYDAFQNEI
jgi:hypothetical protein